MYSNNDFRSYSENHLEHSWGTKPAQKAREKEYNAWYYATHPEKWGVKKALENLEDKVDDKVSDALDKGLLGKTDIDNNLYNAGKSAYSKLKKKTESAIVNTGKKNLTSSAMKLERARRNFEAQRDNPRASSTQKYAAAQAYRKAQAEYNATTRGKVERAIDKGTTIAAQTAERGYEAVKDTTRNIGSGAQQLQSDARYKTTTAKRDARVKADVAARNAGRNVKDRINSALDKTKVDDALLEGYRKTRDAVKNAPGAVAGAAKSAKDYVEDKSGLTARREAKAAWDKFSNTAKDETRASNAWDRAQAAARKNAKAGNDKNAEYYDRVADSKYATMKNLQRRRDTENAEYIRKSDAYDKTPLGRLESIADSIYSGAKDLKDNATRSAANALDRTVASVKDALGYDERDRRDAAVRDTRASGSSNDAKRAAEAQSDYNKTPLGVAENAYKAARRAYDKAVDMYGEGSQGAKKAAETLAGAAQEVYKAGQSSISALRNRTLGTDDDRFETRLREAKLNNAINNVERRNAETEGARRGAERNALRDRTNEQRGIGTQSGRDNGTLTPIQKNRQDKGIPQWFENFAESVGGNAKKASKQIQKYLQEVQKHGADSRQAQEARAEAMSAVTSALEPNKAVVDNLGRNNVERLLDAIADVGKATKKKKR